MVTDIDSIGKIDRNIYEKGPHVIFKEELIRCSYYKLSIKIYSLIGHMVF